MQFRQNIHMLLLLASALIALAGFSITRKFTEFEKSLRQYYGVALYSSRNEVKYRLGIPNVVLGNPQPIVTGSTYKMQRLYYVNRDDGPVNAMPEDKTPDDYSYWAHKLTNGAKYGNEVVFSFSDSLNTVSIACNDVNNTDNSKCPSLAGIHDGDTEDVVVKHFFFAPRQELNDRTKTLYIDQLGLEYVLEKGRVFSIRLKYVHTSRWSMAAQFLYGTLF